MESQSHGSWSVSTNWTVAGGSFDGWVKFGHLDSPAGPRAKAEGRRCTSLLLEAAPPNRPPCEIKNDEALHPTATEECVIELAGEKCSHEGNTGSIKDDGEEVKIPESSLQEDQNDVMLKMVAEEKCSHEGSTGSIKDDGEEAKIPESSLQEDQNDVMLKMVADSTGTMFKVKWADSDTQAPQMVSSDGSSVMAGLDPTLWQPSKTSLNRKQADQASNRRENGEYLEGITNSTSSTDQIQQEDSIEQPQFQIPACVSVGSSVISGLDQRPSKTSLNRKQDEQAFNTGENSECLEVESGITNSTSSTDQIQQKDSIEQPQLQIPACVSVGSPVMSGLDPTLQQPSKANLNRKQDEQASNTRENGEYLEVESGITNSTRSPDQIQQKDCIEQPQFPILACVSGGSSVMSSFDPSLQRPFKTSLSRKEDEQAANTGENGEYLEVESRITNSTSSEDQIQQKESIEQPQFQFPACVSVGVQSDDSVAFPNNQKETTLEQVVSRLSAIEAICLRFEENMLKPISGLEARLLMIERQVDMLAKNSLCFGFPSCTRFSAPSFSAHGMTSNSSSLDDYGSDYHAYRTLEKEKDDIPCDELSDPPNHMLVSVDNTQLLQTFEVSAPEFSDSDDQEISNNLQLPKVCKLEQVEKSSAAVSEGVVANDYAQTIPVKAPDVVIKENANDGELFSSLSSRDLNEADCKTESVSTSSIPQTKVLGLGEFDENCLQETSEGINSSM
ncbi:hypothetical protein NMG60_11029462 [Bertholletia excelsa]